MNSRSRMHSEISDFKSFKPQSRISISSGFSHNENGSTSTKTSFSLCLKLVDGLSFELLQGNSSMPCNITLTDSELIFNDCTGTRTLLKHSLKSEAYVDLLQRKVDVVIVKPNHHRSELTIGCPFKPDVRICIITEAHDQLAYAFMIRDKIKDTICSANNFGMSNSHPSSTLVDRYPDSGVSSSEDYNYLSYPNNPRPIDLSSTFATDAVGVNDSISQVGTFDTHMSEGNQPNLADTRNGFAAAAEEMEIQQDKAHKPWNWNQMDVGMDDAKNILEDDGRVGIFLVRHSERNNLKFTIDVLVAPNSVKSLRFGNDNKEGKFVLDYEKERCARYEETPKMFPTMDELIDHYCKTPLKFKSLIIQLKKYDSTTSIDC